MTQHQRDWALISFILLTISIAGLIAQYKHHDWPWVVVEAVLAGYWFRHLLVQLGMR